MRCHHCGISFFFVLFIQRLSSKKLLQLANISKSHFQKKWCVLSHFQAIICEIFEKSYSAHPNYDCHHFQTHCISDVNYNNTQRLFHFSLQLRDKYLPTTQFATQPSTEVFCLSLIIGGDTIEKSIFFPLKM